MAGSKFSDYLGLKYYKKGEKIKHFNYLRLTNQSEVCCKMQGNIGEVDGYLMLTQDNGFPFFDINKLQAIDCLNCPA